MDFEFGSGGGSPAKPLPRQSPGGQRSAELHAPRRARKTPFPGAGRRGETGKKRLYYLENAV